MKKSFTLIELLIVLVIIGILVTLAVPQYQRFVIRAQSAEAKMFVRVWADEYLHNYLESGHMPDLAYEPESINRNTLKYFFIGIWTTNTPDGKRVYLYAFRKDYQSMPLNEVMSYGVMYSAKPGLFPTFTKIDDGFYRYYVHQKKTGEIGVQPLIFFPFLDGWP